MTEADIPSVAGLEQEIFPDPWPSSSFSDALANDQWNAVVAEHEGVIVGYACFMIAAGESHLTNIATAPAYRRKSVAKHLLERILSTVSERGCELLLLEVRVSNTEAIDFYRQFGFAYLYRRPEYYRHPVEDALVMIRYL
jgi:ribosomal-protein-alanine N-acetyltransferase